MMKFLLWVFLPVLLSGCIYVNVPINPGIQQVRRFFDDTEAIGDAIYNVETDLEQGCTIVDQMDMTRRKKMSADTRYVDLLVPVFRNGKKVYDAPPVEDIRAFCQEQRKLFDQVDPDGYLVGLEEDLYRIKKELMAAHRSETSKKTS